MEKKDISIRKEILESDEYYAEILEVCEGITTPKVYPVIGEDGWLCACGHENSSEADMCEKCGAYREKLSVIFNELFLIQKRNGNEAKRKARERLDKEASDERWRRIDPEVDNIYRSAKNFEETRDNYLEAAKKLESIAGYKDSSELAAEYRELAEDAPLYPREVALKMRRKRIKMISVISAVSLAILALILSTVYFTLVAPGGMRYDVTKEGVTITSYDSFFGGKNVVIPETILGKKVVSIGNGAFRNQKNIISVRIPNTVKTIENNAFSGCTSLVSVTVPESVTDIGASAFSDCTSLRDVYLYADIDAVKVTTFHDCSSLRQIVFKESVKVIEQSAFSNCRELRIIKYMGSEEQWGKIDILTGNNYVESALVIFDFSVENKK